MYSTPVDLSFSYLRSAVEASLDIKKVHMESNSRNESDNRTANTVWMPGKAGMLFKSEMTALAGTIASSWCPQQ